MKGIVRLHAYVRGVVQGVFFRQSTTERARELGLGGWVRNLPDGRVELLAEGPRPKVEELLAFAHIGPPAAQVASLEVIWEPSTGEFQEFKTR
ncbi:MAG: acylphosphatase [Cyanobacteria bacterium REEB65]|nr:acylphosphatase [Cyanobacteria bacterium REEB65]